MNPSVVRLQPEGLENYERHAEIFRRAFARVALSRAYALTDDAERAGIALLRAAWYLLGDQSADAIDGAIEALFNVVMPAIAGATQSWRPETKPKLQPISDPVTGPLPNPFAVGDLPSQALLFKRDPALARHLKAMATAPYATYYAAVDEEERAKVLSGLVYNSTVHRTNPFALRFPNDTNAMKLQGIFISSRSPILVEIYQWEGQTVVSFPWSSARLEVGGQSRVIEAMDAKPAAGLDARVLIPLAADYDDALRIAQVKQAEEAARAANERARALATR